MIEAFDCGRFGAIIEFEGHSMLLRRDWRASTRRSNCSSRRQWASCHPGRLSPVRVRRGPFSIRSEERRVGKECVSSVALGGRRSIKKKNKSKIDKNTLRLKKKERIENEKIN